MEDIRKSQRLLVGHGALVLLFAFVIGFGFVFFLICDIRLWPIPWVIDYQMPGTYDAWRMAHMEGITNGFGLWSLVAGRRSAPLESLGQNISAHCDRNDNHRLDHCYRLYHRSAISERQGARAYQ